MVMDVWLDEEIKCRDVRARFVAVPAVEHVESERVPLMDVLERRVWFPDVGIYVLRDGEAVMYVGRTDKPLRARLKGAISAGKTWTQAGWASWTVTMQRKPDYPADKVREAQLVQELRPVFYVMGRPKSAKARRAQCACRENCPQCGLPRVHSTL